MATRIWNDDTEGDVWIVEPADPRDLQSSCTYSSDTDSTTDTMETIQSAEVAGKQDHCRVAIHLTVLTRFFSTQVRACVPRVRGCPHGAPSRQR
jgi:hypothetical protein